MTTRILATAAKAGLATLTVGVALTALAGPASANSFSNRVYQGSVSYDDGADQLCVYADETGIRDRAIIEVTLTPYDSSRGPVVHVTDIDDPGGRCGSLATAYEDTYYKAVIKSTISYDRTTGKSTYDKTVVSFYS